jgi:hypothetical protein
MSVVMIEMKEVEIGTAGVEMTAMIVEKTGEEIVVEEVIIPAVEPIEVVAEVEAVDSSGN